MPPAAIRALALIAAFAVGAHAASAGEAAARRVIGFSADGGHFALEEFGAADAGMGQGGVHSFISFVDTTTNAILDASVGATLEGGDKALLAPLRHLSAQAAAATIAFHKIGAPGRLIGADSSSRAGELFTYFDVWPVEKAAKASLEINAPEIGGKAQLALDYESPPHTDEGEPASDKSPPFALILVKPDGKRIVLAQGILDLRATDRGAFYKYAIAEAWLLPRPGKTPVIAAIVETFTQGGEGPDRNFIPVAIALRAP
jgi:predicted secreted protein